MVLSCKPIMLVAFQGTLVCAVAVSSCFQFVLAKAKPKALQGLIEEQPKFDVSLSNYTFNLGIKHTQLIGAQRKPILHAQDSMGLLHGGARTFRLQTAAQDVALQSQNAKTGRGLQGQVDQNGRPLTGKVAENPRSPLNTKEHFHATFQLDLRKLTAEVAPDIVTQMESEIGQASSKTADIVARQEKEMEPKLRGRTPQAGIPPLPAKVNANLGLSRAVDSKIAASKKNEDGTARQAAQKMNLELARGYMIRGVMPQMPGDKMPMMPKIPAIPAQHSTAIASVDRAVRDMTAELAHANRKTPSAEDLNNQLEGAKSRARTKADAGQPGLDAILTHARNMPGTTLPAVPKATGQGDAYDVVPWDAWHAKFAELARDPHFSQRQ